MPNKALRDKSKYVIACYVGRSTGLLRNMLLWYWTKAVGNMSEGENGRCYLCKYAMTVVEHKEDPKRKFWIRCILDKTDYEPCSVCEVYKAAKKEDR